MACKWFKVCPLRRMEEEGKISDKWKEEYCKTKNEWKDCKRYQAAEKGKSHPDNLMPDGSILEINK